MSGKPYTRVEQALAWGGLTVVIVATVAGTWLASGPVFGLFALAVFGGALTWCAVTGNLIRKD